MTPRGIRNNNPGNIEYHESIPWRGQTGSDGRFATFDTAHNGLRALAKQLLVYEDKYGLRTVRGIINRWAPPVENNTSAYVNAVASALGVGPDDVISTHGPRTLAGLVTAIVQHENGQQPYTVPQITAAVADALGAESTVGVTKPQNVDKTTQNASSFVRDSVPQTVQPKKVGMDPLTLVSMLSGVFAPLIRSKLDKALGSDVGKPLADNLLALAQSATGKTDPLEAVAIARQSPEITAKLEQAASDWLAQMAPILDKAMQYDQALWAAQQSGRESAAKVAQGERWDMTPYLVAFAGAATTACSITLLGAIVYQSVAKTIDPVLLGLAGPLLAITFAAWKSIFDYRFDGTKESSAQTKAITEAVRQRGGV